MILLNVHQALSQFILKVFLLLVIFVQIRCRIIVVIMMLEIYPNLV